MPSFGVSIMGRPSAVPVLRQSSRQLCCNSPAKVPGDGSAAVARLGFAKAAVTQGAWASQLASPQAFLQGQGQPLERSAGAFPLLSMSFARGLRA